MTRFSFPTLVAKAIGHHKSWPAQWPDAAPKPAYDALLKLVKGEWWVSPTRLTTDAQGQLSFSGFAGDYEISAVGQKARFSLVNPGESQVTVNL